MLKNLRDLDETFKQFKFENGEKIINNTFAHEMYGIDKTILSIRDLDEKYTPIDIDGFTTWHHAYGINGKTCYFCESI